MIYIYDIYMIYIYMIYIYDIYHQYLQIDHHSSSLKKKLHLTATPPRQISFSRPPPRWDTDSWRGSRPGARRGLAQVYGKLMGSYMASS